MWTSRPTMKSLGRKKSSPLNLFDDGNSCDSAFKLYISPKIYIRTVESSVFYLPKWLHLPISFLLCDHCLFPLTRADLLPGQPLPPDELLAGGRVPPDEPARLVRSKGGRGGIVKSRLSRAKSPKNKKLYGTLGGGLNIMKTSY